MARFTRSSAAIPFTGISRRAYGNDDGWRLIFSVNREIIGANPSLIEIGQPLAIPCLGEEVAEPTTSTETIRRGSDDRTAAATVEGRHSVRDR